MFPFAEYLAGLVGLQQLGGDDSWEDGAAADATARHDAGAVADTDTIAAIVTGAAAGAVSIIRLSGVDAVGVAQQVFRPAGGSRAAGTAWEPESHRVYYGRAVDAAGSTLDEVGWSRLLPTHVAPCMRQAERSTGRQLLCEL